MSKSGTSEKFIFVSSYYFIITKFILSVFEVYFERIAVPKA